KLIFSPVYIPCGWPDFYSRRIRDLRGQPDPVVHGIRYRVVFYIKCDLRLARPPTERMARYCRYARRLRERPPLGSRECDADSDLCNNWLCQPCCCRIRWDASTYPALCCPIRHDPGNRRYNVIFFKVFPLQESNMEGIPVSLERTAAKPLSRNMV